MKAAVWKDAGKIEIEEIPEPSPGKGEVLVRVRAAGICGTDLAIYQGKFPKERAVPPRVLGHEFSGEIADVGAGVKEFRGGERVVVDPLISCGSCFACSSGFPHVCATLKIIGIDVDGAFAEYVVSPADRVHLLPARIPFETGAAVEPLAVAVHAVRRSGLAVGDGALVVGGGPIGILVALVTRALGAQKVLVTELQEYRLDMVKEMELSSINPLKEDLKRSISARFGLTGPDIVFEASGTAAGFQQAIDFVRIRGSIVEVSLPKVKTDLDMRRVNFGELTLLGSRVYSPIDIESAISFLADDKLRLESLLKTYPPEESQVLFGALVSGEGKLMKAILNFS